MCILVLAELGTGGQDIGIGIGIGLAYFDAGGEFRRDLP
jgi:hypothetical protein